MNIRKEIRNRRARRRKDNTDMILMALSGGPQTLPEIKDQFFALPRRFGIFAPLYRMSTDDDNAFTREIGQDVEELIARDWVVRQEDRYALTPAGRKLAQTRLAGVRRALDLAAGLMRPETVSRVAVVFHLLLAAVKLPAALLSGSVGLLNDSIDTLMDGLSSLMVYFGVRFRRERAVNVLLVALMLAVGCGTLFASARRLFVPEAPSVDWFSFLSAVLSALVCLLLWLYQRYAGLRHGSMALIAQSVDSRNHILVAAGVTAGLIATLLRFSLLDTLVGIVVAVLILRSALELAVSLVRSWSGGEEEFSRYPMPLAGQIESLRLRQLRDWMLYLVESRAATTRAALQAEAACSLTFDHHPMLREIGLPDQRRTAEDIARCLQSMIEDGWLTETKGVLKVAPAAKKRLDWQTRRSRRAMRLSLLGKEDGGK